MHFIQYKLLIFISLIIWFIIGNVRLSTRLNQNSATYQIDLLKSKFNLILKYLSKFHIELLLIDPILLDYLFIHQLSFQQYHQPLITFGIFNESISIIRPLLFSLRNLSIIISQNSSIDHIFLEYNQHIIHLAVLHKKKTYFLIEKNIASLPITIKLTYGDTLRAIEPIETELMKTKFSFLLPRNISHFLWLYNTSEFISCNRNLADEMKTEYHLYQNITQVNLTIPSMRNIIWGLNKFEKHYWLAGGTLLGWYRHCGFIPYTQDVDLGLFAEEYDENIRNYFLGNPVIYLWGALGLVNDSLEFRLFNGRYTIDLFWAYREDDHRWCGYQIKRMKYKRILPLLPKLCSCDLSDYLFSIPCSPIDYLNNEYGLDRWKRPLETSYTWINLKYDSIWDDISWMYAVRLYTSKGKLRTDKYAIDWIENQFDYSLKTIPSILNVLPDEQITLPPVKH